MKKLLYVSLAGNAVLLVGLIVVLVTSNSSDQTTQTAEIRSAATEEAVAPDPAAAPDPAVGPTESAPTEEASGSAPEGAPAITAPSCFDHFSDTHPSVGSAAWIYMTPGEEEILHAPTNVVVMVDDNEIVGAIRLEYQTIGEILNLFDALDGDCEPLEINEQQPEEADRYLTTEVDGAEYRLHVYKHQNLKLGTVRLEKP